ncbi:MAG: DEAD/DEAH box helicase [Dehalococcoidia bacterium]|nr:DEAD/DEAH box helicase [Dehalococcoidia bacterium]
MPTYVAIDLETTGTDPKRNDIMEIGAVRFDEHGVSETFQSFVRPAEPIPYRIRLLTNIEQADVDTAPVFDDVREALVRFVGDAPIIGQNVAFDLAFLERKAVRFNGPVYDTAELGHTLLWDARQHSLQSMAQYFAIDFPVRHRALLDALATRDVFLSLRGRALGLPPAVLAEVARIASASPWSLRGLLAELTMERVREIAASAGMGNGKASRDSWPAMVAVETPQPVPEAEAVALLRSAGVRPGLMEAFEQRPQQEAMAGAVASALSEGQHLLVEAGTGTGKSLAYLIPAALYAMRNETRIIISTNTIALQQQLMDKDVPALRAMLGEEGERLRVAQLKGRANYLCLRRFTALRHGGPFTVEEARLLARLSVWLPHTETGDRAELNLTMAEDGAWARVAANESCGAACVGLTGAPCFLARQRRRAEGAHLLVVNHALLLSDIVSGGHVLAEYDHLIIDEAHHVEDEATSQFGFAASQSQVLDYLDRLHSAGRANVGVTGLSAALRLVMRLAQGKALGAGAMGAISEGADDLARTTGEARTRVNEFYSVLRAFVENHAASSGDYETRLLLSSGVRRQPAWSEVEMGWDNLALLFKDTLAVVERIRGALADAGESLALDALTLVEECAALHVEGSRLLDGLGAIVGREDQERIAWLTAAQSGSTVLNSAPLHVGDILRDALFMAKRSIVLTGATLTAGDGFAYIRERLGIDEARELELGSPFDYQRSALLLLPREMKEPGQPGYQKAVEEAVLELVRASQGRALVLLTSHAAVRQTASAIRGPLEAEQILVQAHGVDGSPRQLIQTLREHPRCVLLGTSSFWEGVDVVGESLSLLIIAKLPFHVPTEPVFAARSQLFDDPFKEYALPGALIRFRQGIGRLIRSRTDRGVLVVLDRRIRSKSYGQAFIDALPDCRVEDVGFAGMADKVKAWLSPDVR